MSIKVDFGTPLTMEERKYLSERGRYADIERMDNTFGTSAPEDFDTSGDGTAPLEMPLLTSEARAARKEQLLRELELLNQEDGTSEEEGDGDVAPYEAWKVAELDAELKRRDLPVTGDKAAKVAALYADDESNES